ncbi:MAG: chemotaxis protein CheX [Deltaproteobacteria bacterium]|jgi:chemotaxis protein CheX|nr:chemotaxis protein CheX [Deltaproteobacteria bacterium]
MDLELLNIFTQSAVSVIETMAFTKVAVGKPVLKVEKVTNGDVTGIIGLANSEFKGTLVISFEAEAIIAVVNNMLGSNYTEMSSDVIDAVGEITNMICGASKRSLADSKQIILDMASPTTIIGRDLMINFPGSLPVVEIPFATEKGKFIIDITLGKEHQSLI